MKRSKIMQRGILLTVLAVIVPLGLTFAASWTLSIYAAHDRLQTLAAIANDRARQTFAQASQALKSIAVTDLEPCSPQGIEQMRMIAMNTFSVETVATKRMCLPARHGAPRRLVRGSGRRISSLTTG